MPNQILTKPSKHSYTLPTLRPTTISYTKTQARMQPSTEEETTDKHVTIVTNVACVIPGLGQQGVPQINIVL